MGLPSSDRGGAVVLWVCLHTAEGSRRVGDLYAFFDRNQNASSHAGADGTTLSDGWVPRSRAAWTLRNGNSRSVNLEMCGFARWNRSQWLSEGTVDGVVNPRNMVRNAAKWAKQECEALGVPKSHISVNGVRISAKGIIMHDDYSKGSGDGDHWDIGTGFPWDVFFADMGGTSTEEDELTWQPLQAWTQKVYVAAPGDRKYKEFKEAAEVLGDAYFNAADANKKVSDLRKDFADFKANIEGFLFRGGPDTEDGTKPGIGETSVIGRLKDLEKKLDDLKELENQVRTLVNKLNEAIDTP